MTSNDADALLELVFPRKHPVTDAAIARIQHCMANCSDAEVQTCLKLFRFMVAHADVGLYEHMAKTQPKMWNDSTFNGIRTLLVLLKTFGDNRQADHASEG